MKNEKLFELLGEIDWEYVIEAEVDHEAMICDKSVRKSHVRKTLLLLAAVIAGLALVGYSAAVRLIRMSGSNGADVTLEFGTAHIQEDRVYIAMTVNGHFGQFELGLDPIVAVDPELTDQLTFKRSTTEDQKTFLYEYSYEGEIGDVLYVTPPEMYVIEEMDGTPTGSIEEGTVYHTPEGEPWFEITSVEYGQNTAGIYSVRIKVKPLISRDIADPMLLVDGKPYGGLTQWNGNGSGVYDWGEFEYDEFGIITEEQAGNDLRLIFVDRNVRVEPDVEFKAEGITIKVIKD